MWLSSEPWVGHALWSTLGALAILAICAAGTGFGFGLGFVVGLKRSGLPGVSIAVSGPDKKDDGDGDDGDDSSKSEAEKEKEKENSSEQRYKEVEEWWSSIRYCWEERAKQIIAADNKYLFIGHTRHPVNGPSQLPDEVVTVFSFRLAQIIQETLQDYEATFDDKLEFQSNMVFLKYDELVKVKKSKTEEIEVLEAAKPKPEDKNEDDKEEKKEDNKEAKEEVSKEEKPEVAKEKKKDEDQGKTDASQKEDKPKESGDESKVADASSKNEDDADSKLAELKLEVEELGILLGWLDVKYAQTRAQLEKMYAVQQVSFKYLWHLFHTGVLVTTAIETSDKKIGITIKTASYAHNQDFTRFTITGHHWIWNGKVWKRRSLCIRIPQFKGTKPTRELPCQIISEKVLADLERRGRIARSLADVKYMKYTGMLVKVIYAGGGSTVVKTTADGRAMIDVKNYRRLNYSRDDIGDEPDNDYDDGYSLPTTIPEIPDEDLWCLPPTIHAFSFVLKEWGEMEVEGFSEIQFDEHAYDYLVLDKAQKQLIKGLVENSRLANAGAQLTDIITGKGGGLVFCLHGSAGCGKTLTAEAVAEQLKRPLYLVGAGELGTAAEAVESNLRDALDLCTTWDAVMLIDEADVYLERRDVHELSRNALVSVFLRTLDYSQGILFLTTNRVQYFDPAFVSRFSLAIKYPDLDRHSRLQIWTRFMERAGLKIIRTKLVNGTTTTSTTSTSTSTPDRSESPVIVDGTSEPEIGIVTASELNTLSEKPINGRSIRNTIRTAKAMAMASNEPLGLQHILKVLTVSESFAKDLKDPDTEGVYAAPGEGWTDKTRLYF